MDPRAPFKTFAQAKTFAHSEISKIDASLAIKFLKILEFCFKNPEITGGLGNLQKFSPRWIETKARQFAKERNTQSPRITGLVTDPLVSTISQSFFDIEQIELLIEHHKIGMAAEQIIGQLLEEYIASKVEELGWIWCTGKMIKATDFIKFPSEAESPIVLLQIKNRSNSENSSSAAIREGTEIKPWYRMDAGTGETRWENFPNILENDNLNEEGFREFVKKKIQVWRL
jgi:hypothetical protein